MNRPSPKKLPNKNIKENPPQVASRAAFERLLPYGSLEFYRQAVAIHGCRHKMRLQFRMRYRRRSLGSRSPFAGHFHYSVSLAPMSCSAISRKFISFLEARSRGEKPTLHWKANSSMRLALSGFSTRAAPDRPTTPVPTLLIIFTSKQRPSECGLLAQNEEKIATT